MRFIPVAALLLSVLVGACGGGSSGSDKPVKAGSSPGADTLAPPRGGFPVLSAAPANNALVTSCRQPVALSADATVTGVVEYERVPIGLFGLEYDKQIKLPARAVVVEAVDASAGQCSETVVATTLTNAKGQYGLNVPVNQSVCVQIRAQLYRDGSNGGGQWDIQITDNTNANAPYYLVNNTVATPAQHPVRNFLAASGFDAGASGYTQARAAAPFAILDTLCESIEALIAVDSQLQLPPLQVHWSVDNVASKGELSEGEIGGAFFRKLRRADQFNNTLLVLNEIFLLGDENNNTDEYDQHVISHEFGHFIVNSLSRSDAFGGEHSLGNVLDMRVAYDEGIADALSGMALAGVAPAVLKSPEIYRDSLGHGQGAAFRFNLNNNISGSRGWYSEASVFSIIYNVFDELNNGRDELTLGYAPILQVMTSTAYKDSDVFVTIFSFIHQLKQMTGNALAIDYLVADEHFQSIQDELGSDEDIADNDIASKQDIDAIYTPLPLNRATTVCSNNQFGVHNKLAVQQYLLFEAEREKAYRFYVLPTPGPHAAGQAMLQIFRKGRLLREEQASSAGQSIYVEQVLSGRHVLSIADAGNLDPHSEGVGRRCFTVSVE